MTDRLLFKGFANVWTPVTPSRALGKKPLGITLAGERLVLFRDGRGGVGGLLDRCPHRGAALSLGTVTPDGCVACPFHGWEFNTEGVNTHVPFNPEARRDHLGTVAVPVRDLGGLLWVYTAPGTHPPTEPSPPDTLVRTDVTRTFIQKDWSTHWTRAMENMLDSPHVPFVHRATIGRDQRRRMHRGSRMVMRWQPTPYGGDIGMSLDDAPEVGLLEFHKPNVMVLKIPIPGRLFRIHAVCVPTEARGTRMLIIGARDFARPAVFNPFFNRSNQRILEEDRTVLESSDPPEVPPPGDERSVASDRPTLQFRKYYFDVLRDSSVARPERVALPVVTADSSV